MTRPDVLSTGAAELFADVNVRPTPQRMGELVMAGLTEDQLVAAGKSFGYEKPQMVLTLTDLDDILPFMYRINASLLNQHQHQDARYLFAGRDAELLYDHFALTYPNASAKLLPASTRLWDSSGMSDPYLAIPFLESYGLSKSNITNPNRDFVLVDTGFFGTVGELLSKTIEFHYGIRAPHLYGGLYIKMVSADQDALGLQITDFDNSEVKGKIPKGRKAHKLKLMGPAYDIAVALQLMPRYHGHYIDLQQQEEDRVVAIPMHESSYPNLDRTRRGVNESMVNPVGAAITQYRVVKDALTRSRPPVSRV